MKIPAVIQDTVEALAVMGGHVKRFKRKLLVQQGEIEKLINELERIEKFVERREKEIKELINGEKKDED